MIQRRWQRTSHSTTSISSSPRIRSFLAPCMQHGWHTALCHLGMCSKNQATDNWSVTYEVELVVPKFLIVSTNIEHCITGVESEQ